MGTSLNTRSGMIQKACVSTKTRGSKLKLIRTNGKDNTGNETIEINRKKGNMHRFGYDSENMCVNENTRN